MRVVTVPLRKIGPRGSPRVLVKGPSRSGGLREKCFLQSYPTGQSDVARARRAGLDFLLGLAPNRGTNSTVEKIVEAVFPQALSSYWSRMGQIRGLGLY